MATSLVDIKKFPRKSFLNLYHQRWFIEEDYNIMKSRLEVENFSGVSVEAIQQDIHAKVLTKNIAAIAILEADVLAKEKYRQRKNKKISRMYVRYMRWRVRSNVINLTKTTRNII